MRHGFKGGIMKEEFKQWALELKDYLDQGNKVTEDQFVKYIEFQSTDPNFKRALSFYEQDKDGYLLAMTAIELLIDGIIQMTGGVNAKERSDTEVLSDDQ